MVVLGRARRYSIDSCRTCEEDPVVRLAAHETRSKRVHHQHPVDPQVGDPGARAHPPQQGAIPLIIGSQGHVRQVPSSVCGVQEEDPALGMAKEDYLRHGMRPFHVLPRCRLGDNGGFASCASSSACSGNRFGGGCDNELGIAEL
jgi:hypothetical protein